MKSRAIVAGICLCLLSVPLFSTAALARRAPAFVSVGGERILKVADLPDTSSFRSEDGFFDIGLKYKALDLFFLPVHRWDRQFVGFLPGDDAHYLDFTPDEITQLTGDAAIRLPPVDEVDLGYSAAQMVFGRLVFGILFAAGLVVILGRLLRRR